LFAIHTGAVSRSVPRGTTVALLTAASTSSSESSICRACSKYSAPLSLRLTRRLVRLSSRVPSRFSSCITCLLAIAGEMRRRCAAVAKLFSSATRQNTLMLTKESMRSSTSGK
jgi:hypothetical protein